MATLPLLRGSISLEEALRADGNIVQELSYPDKRTDFWLHLLRSRPHIEEVISRHLNISRTDLALGEIKEWVPGSFNVCLPFQITARTSRLPRRCIIRFPLPYKVGEESCPGNVDEKLRCEAATYIWLQSHCPDIPTPRMLGFGFPGGQSFTALSHTSFFTRILWNIRSGLARIFGRTLSSSRHQYLAPYFPYRRQSLLDLGYLIIEYIDEGQMLSRSWNENKSDPKRQANLFRGLSQIILSLMERPLPRIASWTINDLGILSLTNRPLTMSLHQRENLGIPTEIPQDYTYASAEPYYLDLLASQDNVIRYQPNSIHHNEDGETQLAALTSMRALVPKFTDRQGRNGPFVLTLTDLHPSNIFVDNEWHITKIIDLEWACARPCEMVNPPHWISGHEPDEIVYDLEEEYSATHAHFMEQFKREELARHHSTERTQALQTRWKDGSPWYFWALDETPGVLSELFTDHLRPRFAESSNPEQAFDRAVASFWDYGTAKFISAKLAEQEQYLDRLRELFCAPVAETS